MATIGTEHAEIKKAMRAAAAFLESTNGGFRDVVITADKADMIRFDNGMPFGILSAEAFDKARKQEVVTGIGSETRRRVAQKVLRAGVASGVLLPKHETPVTL